MRNQINIINARERMTLHILHACSFNLYAYAFMLFFFKQLIAVVCNKIADKQIWKKLFSFLPYTFQLLLVVGSLHRFLPSQLSLSYLPQFHVYAYDLWKVKKRIYIPYTRHSMFCVIILCRSLLIFSSIAVSEREREHKIAENEIEEEKKVYIYYIVARVGVYCILHWRRSRSSSSRWK